MIKCKSTTTYLFTVLLLLLLPSAASASEEIRLFVVEKSKNPQNILVAYTYASGQCKIEPVVNAGKDYLFDFYWLMDGTDYKPTHPLIKRHVRKRFVAQTLSIDRKRFTVKLADLSELVHDLPSEMISISLSDHPDGTCVAHVRLALGASAGYRTIDIQSIYSKTRTVLGVPVGVNYVELKGRDAATNEKIAIRFYSR